MSNILFKFRSGTNFESLPLPGTSASLFDIKRAIVKVKKLEKAGKLEFDLSIRNANTSEEYTDDNGLLPQGSRLIVHRLPAPRGMGLLERIAKSDMGMTQRSSKSHQVDHSRFYEICSREDDEEFIKENNNYKDEDDKNELEKLQTVMDLYKPNPTLHVSTSSSSYRIGISNHVNSGTNSNTQRPRLNADPEIRNEEQRIQQPKKRATGIPRTFLNFEENSGAATETKNEENNETTSNKTMKLQPNSLGFQELISRGGGKSTHSSKNLDYALQLTSTSVPDYLKCGICGNIVKDAMLLPWDTEGRTACETCIRNALNESGFQCPLTKMEGVSPDDLHPNLGLRKAVDSFVQNVWKKVENIEKEQEIIEEAKQKEIEENDKTVVVFSSSRKRPRLEERKETLEDDDFGGDVFAVSASNENTNNNVKDEPVLASKVEVKEKSDHDAKNVTSQQSEVKTETIEVTEPSKETSSTVVPSPIVEDNDDSSNKKKKQSLGPPPGYTFGIALVPVTPMLPPPPPPPQTTQAFRPVIDNKVPPPPVRNDATKGAAAAGHGFSQTGSSPAAYNSHPPPFQQQPPSYPGYHASVRGGNYHPSARGRFSERGGAGFYHPAYGPSRGAFIGGPPFPPYQQAPMYPFHHPPPTARPYTGVAMNSDPIEGVERTDEKKQDDGKNKEKTRGKDVEAENHNSLTDGKNDHEDEQKEKTKDKSQTSQQKMIEKNMMSRQDQYLTRGGFHRSRFTERGTGYPPPPYYHPVRGGGRGFYHRAPYFRGRPPFWQGRGYGRGGDFHRGGR